MTGRLFTCTKPQCQKMDESVFQISSSSSPGLLKVSSVRCSALFIGLTRQQAHIQRQWDVYYALAQEHTCSSHMLSSGYTHTYTLTGWLREIYHMLEHTLTQCSEKSRDVDRSNLSPEESLSAGRTYSDLANNECSLSLGNSSASLTFSRSESVWTGSAHLHVHRDLCEMVWIRWALCCFDPPQTH